MGEYAIRKSDSEEIKIGTCENMYYIRFEDRGQVSPIEGSTNLSNPAELVGLRFRLPFPDEDEVRPGEYENPFRGLRLFRTFEPEKDWQVSHEDWHPPVELDPGSFQMRHEKSGLLFSVPCHHGEKLPDLGSIRPFWNGKSHAFELVQVKMQEAGKLMPVVQCRFCEEKWRFEWEHVLRWIHDPVLYERCAKYAMYGGLDIE